MLGLAAGSDCFGATVQVSGLILLLATLGGLGKSPRDRAFALLLALPPAILPLSVTQKPQLFPAAAIVIAMILARDEKSRRKALAKLLPFQRKDFAGLFTAMDGFPVVIRTLDPPLHEFLPKREDLMVDIAILPYADIKKKKELVATYARFGAEVKNLKTVLPGLLKK